MFHDFNLFECTLPFKETQHPHAYGTTIIQFIRYTKREVFNDGDWRLGFSCYCSCCCFFLATRLEICRFLFYWFKLWRQTRLLFRKNSSIRFHKPAFILQLSNLWNEKPITIQFSQIIFPLSWIKPPKIDSANMVKTSEILLFMGSGWSRAELAV